jgi:hypothetical protein
MRRHAPPCATYFFGGAWWRKICATMLRQIWYVMARWDDTRHIVFRGGGGGAEKESERHLMINVNYIDGLFNNINIPCRYGKPERSAWSSVNM